MILQGCSYILLVRARLVVSSEPFRLKNGLIAGCRIGDPAERREMTLLADDQIPLIVNLYARQSLVVNIRWKPLFVFRQNEPDVQQFFSFQLLFGGVGDDDD